MFWNKIVATKFEKHPLIQFPSRPIRSQLFQQRVVFVVRADPIPDHRAGFSDSNRAPAQTNPHGKYRERRVNLLELKTRMMGILPPDAIRLERALLDFLRKFRVQLPKHFSRARGHCLFQTAASCLR